MKTFYEQLFYTDKKFRSPILGDISCSALNDKYVECKKQQSKTRNKHDECAELSIVSTKCYTSKKEEFNTWANKQFEETNRLITHLKEHGSEVPDRILENSWAIFTNPENLLRYQKEEREGKKRETNNESEKN